MYCDAFIHAGIEPDRALRLAISVQTASEGAILMARSEQSVQAMKEIGKEMAELISNAMKT